MLNLVVCKNFQNIERKEGEKIRSFVLLASFDRSGSQPSKAYSTEPFSRVPFRKCSMKCGGFVSGMKRCLLNLRCKKLVRKKQNKYKHKG